MKTIHTLTALILLVSAVTASAQTIAQWTFETSVPTTGGPLTPEVGSGTATSNTAGTFSNPSGNGSNESWSTNGWNINEYFQFSVNSTNNSILYVTWDQTGSNTGPRDFSFSYSFDSFATSSTAQNYTVINTTWNVSGTPSALNSYSYTVDLSGVVGTATNIDIRLTNTTTVSIQGGVVAAGGTGRVDNFLVSTVAPSAVPEPSSYAAIFGVAVLTMVVARRRKSS